MVPGTAHEVFVQYLQSKVRGMPVEDGQDIIDISRYRTFRYFDISFFFDISIYRKFRYDVPTDQQQTAANVNVDLAAYWSSAPTLCQTSNSAYTSYASTWYERTHKIAHTPPRGDNSF